MAHKANTALRARRMLALLPYLKQGETVALSDLADAVGASVAEVAADLTTLSFCGVPPFTPDEMIELEIGDDTVHVYSAPPSLDRPVRLSPREARALVTALEAAGHDAETPLVARLLEAAAAEFDAAELASTVRAGGGEAPVAAIYSVLAEAIDRSTKVRIEYFTASSGTQSVRVIQPHALVNERGAWYVSGFCENAGEVRTFRLDRVRLATSTAELFEAPAMATASVAPVGADLPIAVLRLAPGSRHSEERDWPGATFIPKPNGAVFAEVPYSSATWVARRVAAGLGSIDAIETAEVRAAVREIARAGLAAVKELASPGE
jgi:predicted DNA-binding transcriptional regulator YafY